ncbi:WD40 repeat domain-containing protein [Streptomyces phaeochromogenes]|uniref:WD40 repeat domain-containing protein n=1 Tax=Streptomyces phaeochromogenes TaxID=1923 RepID=UPI00386D2B42|nr:WD40 repeat domain-containing protein [Streptomyces phaeochromogenes]
MNMDQLVRDALHEQAADTTTAPPDFAGRVLAVRRRRRTRTIAGAAVATAVAVAVGVAVPMLDGGKDEPRLATQMNQSDIIAHPDQTPPRDFIAAGNTALAAYYTSSTVKESADQGVARRTYHLLDQKTGKYVKTTKWSFLDVAPGMRTAAVLEKGLPTKRIGLLDLLTGEVERWIPVDRGVAGVEFSPDGSKLVATTYSENPDQQKLAPNDSDGDGKKNDWMPPWDESYRTGFYVLDVDSGKGSWSKVTVHVDEDMPGFLNPRQDFAFSNDAKLVYSGLTMEPNVQYYDFEGKEVATPANEKYLNWYVDAGLSPDGKLAAGDSAGGAKTTASEINDPYTGKRLHKIPGQQLLAWVDNKRLIAFDIAPGTNEFHNRLVLVTIGSDKTVPLSGFRKGNDGAAGRWTPIFAER